VMTPTETVAVIGAASTTAVALAGIFSNAIFARAERRANRQLADLQREHDEADHAAQRSHELMVKRVERLYEDRKAAYVDLLLAASRKMERQQAYETWLNGDQSDAEPPFDEPDAQAETAWDIARMRIWAIAPQSLDDALGDFIQALNAFNLTRAKIQHRRERNDAYDNLKPDLRNDLGDVMARFGTLRNVFKGDLAAIEHATT
jgi:hypothetical protein